MIVALIGNHTYDLSTKRSECDDTAVIVRQDTYRFVLPVRPEDPLTGGIEVVAIH